MRAKSVAVVLVLAASLPLAGLGQRARSGSPPEHRSTASPDVRVDLNHASLEQLLKVPGMTRTWAQRIIRFRPYHSKQDLIDEGIVSGEVYGRIRDYVIAHRDKN
ncbi:MAG: helix-hairpin-helix domain-containing protein [Terracidiphilus sp.]